MQRGTRKERSLLMAPMGLVREVNGRGINDDMDWQVSQKQKGKLVIEISKQTLSLSSTSKWKFRIFYTSNRGKSRALTSKIKHQRRLTGNCRTPVRFISLIQAKQDSPLMKNRDLQYGWWVLYDEEPSTVAQWWLSVTEEQDEVFRSLNGFPSFGTRAMGAFIWKQKEKKCPMLKRGATVWTREKQARVRRIGIWS